MRLHLLLLVLLPCAMAQFPFTAFNGFRGFFQPIQNAIQVPLLRLAV